MSGPNKSYDPVEVSTLDPTALAQAVAEALAAFAAADSLDSLKAARLAHQGDSSALSQANREIGDLPARHTDPLAGLRPGGRGQGAHLAVGLRQGARVTLVGQARRLE